jgi:hypothetical protein
MIICISGSMQFSEKKLELKKMLEEFGHEVRVTPSIDLYVGKSDEEKEALKIDEKNNHDAIRVYWQMMQGADALLVANYDKGDRPNHIGGNAFLEMGFAHVMGQKIFLLNPIPDNPYYRTEIEAMRPVVIHGDINVIA